MARSSPRGCACRPPEARCSCSARAALRDGCRRGSRAAPCTPASRSIGPGPFTVQVLASTASGPRPVAEASVFADVEPPAHANDDAAPGEEAPEPGRGDDDELAAMLATAREASGEPPARAGRPARRRGARACAADGRRPGGGTRRGRRRPDRARATAGLAFQALGENVAHAADARPRPPRPLGEPLPPGQHAAPRLRSSRRRRRSRRPRRRMGRRDLRVATSLTTISERDGEPSRQERRIAGGVSLPHRASQTSVDMHLKQSPAYQRKGVEAQGPTPPSLGGLRPVALPSPPPQMLRRL